MFELERFDARNIDLVQFAEMYRLCLNQNIDEDYIRWKYLNNPAGLVFGYLAYSADRRMAGFYGVIPEKFVINGKECLGYQSMDTMTHPDFQRKGLFTLLANKTYDELYQKSPDMFIIGIPGSNSFHGFVNKLNWIHLGNISYTFSYKRLFYLQSIFKKAYMGNIRELDKNDNSLKTFLKNYTSKIIIHPQYDYDFIKWRILDNSKKTYRIICQKDRHEIESVLIYSIDVNNRCFIECYLSANNSANNLRAFIKYLFEYTDSNWIYTWNSLTSKKLYKEIGFFKNPFSKGLFSYKIPFIFYSKSNIVFFKDISNFDLQPIIQD